MRLRGRHYETGQPIDIVCHGDTIAEVTPTTSAPADADAAWIAPALCDVQVNGAEGRSFGSATLTRDDVRHVLGVLRRHGVSEILPTLITASRETLLHGFHVLRQACDDDPTLARGILGFHLEGPYLSPEDGPRGAHPRAHIRSPDWDEFCRFQDAAGGRIRLVTLAPERPGALELIENLVAHGVVVALGHTAATGATIRAAIAAGACMSTHLGNGSHAVLPRHDNYLWEQLAADELWASIIVDGHHLPPGVVKCLVRAKTPSRLILTCDAGPLAGLPPGRYRDWESDLEIVADPSGGEPKIVVAGTPYLAGSWVFTDSCVRKIIACAGLPLAQAIELATNQPRKLLALPPRRLEPGQPADLILFEHSQDQPFSLNHVVIAGIKQPVVGRTAANGILDF